MKTSAFLIITALLPLTLRAEEPPATPVAPCTTTIKGSMVKAGGIIANPIMFVTALDGAEVERARKNWDQPICIPPGKHELDIGFSQAQYSGKALATLDVVEGHNYEIAFQGTWTKGFVYWLRDRDSGEPLTVEAPMPRRNDSLLRIALLPWLPDR
jgi:hypothetical protein